MPPIAAYFLAKRSRMRDSPPQPVVYPRLFSSIWHLAFCLWNFPKALSPIYRDLSRFTPIVGEFPSR
jgi:hypothetical protein